MSLKKEVGEKRSRRWLSEGFCLRPQPVNAERSYGPRPRCQPSSWSKAADHRQKLQPKSAEQPGPVSTTFPGAEPVPLAHLEMFVLRGSSRRLCPGKRQPGRKATISMSTCCGRRGGGEGFPSLDILHPNPKSLFSLIEARCSQHKPCLPRDGGMQPQESPPRAELCKPAANPSSSAVPDPWDLAALPVPALRISLAVAESLFIVLAEGLVSLLPSKFPGI